jgi:hypothetical protein
MKRALAGPLSFARVEGLVDFDLLGFVLFGLGDFNREQPVLELSLDFVCVDVDRQAEGAYKLPIGHLPPVEVLLLAFFSCFIQP